MQPPPHHAARQASTGLGRYRLIRLLAKGGMGEVYLAEAAGAAGFAKRVVVKVLRPDLAADPQLVAQLVAEGRLLEALDHPNIAQILDIGQQGEVFWLAMEYVEGFDLRALLRALPDASGRGRLDATSALHIVASVARALEHAQTRKGTDGRPLGIVHHDVSPSNVMVRRDGHVKLIDFGVARAAVLGKLAPGALRGKLPYLSPEHTRRQAVDGRADVFALGLVAFELLCGERALDISEPGQLEAAHQRLASRVGLLDGQGLPAGVTGLVRDMTALDPAQRCGSAAEIADRAERLLVQAGESSAARTLATALVNAFDHLESRTGSFDQTLAGILGLADAVPAEDGTGTVSLPGLDAIAVASASARDEPQGAPQRWRKRWLTLLVSVLGLALAGGYWLGQRGDGPRVNAALPAPPEPAATATLPAAAAQHPRLTATDRPAAELAASATPTFPATAASLPHTGPAVIPLAQAPPAAQAADEEARAKPREAAKASRGGVLRFRVQPFDCRVRVDGELRRPAAHSDRYEVKVTAGDHRIRVEDPASGQSREVWVRGVRDGEERILKGGICLGEGCLPAPAPPPAVGP